jgi:hypothetical protein
MVMIKYSFKTPFWRVEHGGLVMWMFENVDHMVHVHYVCYHLCQNKGGYAQFAIVLTSILNNNYKT